MLHRQWNIVPNLEIVFQSVTYLYYTIIEIIIPGIFFYQPAVKKNTLSLCSFAPMFCRKPHMGGWGEMGRGKEALVPGQLIQQEHGSCLGLGFRVSLWKVVCELLMYFWKTNFPGCSKELTSAHPSPFPGGLTGKQQLFYATYCVQRTSFCPTTWAFVTLISHPSWLGHNSGVRSGVSPKPQPFLPANNNNKLQLCIRR